MKRSEINCIMREADLFIRKHGFFLPPFAYWSVADWKCKGEEAGEIVESQLGWDITDFGGGRFDSMGLFLFTIRNGSQDEMRQRRGKLYCEKLMIVGVDQVTPTHFHWNKVEDIINRGGGKLLIQLYNATGEEELANTPITVSVDGVKRQVNAGGTVVLVPGESITIRQRVYHKFWAQEARILGGEVSLVNDDRNDNRFCEAVGRFPVIDEDEEPLHLLVSDYPKYYLCAQADE